MKTGTKQLPGRLGRNFTLAALHGRIHVGNLLTWTNSGQIRPNPAKSGYKKQKFYRRPLFSPVKSPPSVFIRVHLPRRSLKEAGPWLSVRFKIKITKRTHFHFSICL